MDGRQHEGRLRDRVQDCRSRERERAHAVMSNALEAPGPVLTMPGAPVAFHLMAKPTGAICNLDCEYCFFLSKEMLYPGSRFRMAADLQETYIGQLLEAHVRAPEPDGSGRQGTAQDRHASK